MPFELLLEVIGVALAIGGLLLQTKKNATAPSSWANLSTAGRIVLALVVLAGTLRIQKSRVDSAAQQTSSARQRAVIDSLQATNQYLIKVMSVAGGYSARLHGIVTFARSPTDVEVRHALQNLFFKFAAVDLTASNRFGNYRGRVDYGAHPEVYLFRNLAAMTHEPGLLPADLSIPEDERVRSFYFDVRCSALKILNDDKIQYAQFPGDAPVHAQITTWPGALRDFQSLYGVTYLRVYRIDLEELGSVPIDSTPRDRRLSR